MRNDHDIIFMIFELLLATNSKKTTVHSCKQSIDQHSSEIRPTKNSSKKQIILKPFKLTNCLALTEQKSTYQRETAAKHCRKNKPLEVLLLHKKSYPAAKLQPAKRMLRKRPPQWTVHACTVLRQAVVYIDFHRVRRGNRSRVSRTIFGNPSFFTFYFASDNFCAIGGGIRAILKSFILSFRRVWVLDVNYAP